MAAYAISLEETPLAASLGLMTSMSPVTNGGHFLQWLKVFTQNKDIPSSNHIATL